MVRKRRVVRRLTCDGRLSISFLEQTGLPISALYSGHKSNNGLRLKPFDPYADIATESDRHMTMFATGTTSKTVVVADGQQGSRVEYWLFLTPRSRKLSETTFAQKSGAETEILLRQLGLKSKHAIDVDIEYDARSIVIRPLL